MYDLVWMVDLTTGWGWTDSGASCTRTRGWIVGKSFFQFLQHFIFKMESLWKLSESFIKPFQAKTEKSKKKDLSSISWKKVSDIFCGSLWSFHCWAMKGCAQERWSVIAWHWMILHSIVNPTNCWGMKRVRTSKWTIRRIGAFPIVWYGDLTSIRTTQVLFLHSIILRVFLQIMFLAGWKQTSSRPWQVLLDFSPNWWNHELLHNRSHAGPSQALLRDVSLAKTLTTVSRKKTTEDSLPISNSSI